MIPEVLGSEFEFHLKSLKVLSSIWGPSPQRDGVESDSNPTLRRKPVSSAADKPKTLNLNDDHKGDHVNRSYAHPPPPQCRKGRSKMNKLMNKKRGSAPLSTGSVVSRSFAA